MRAICLSLAPILRCQSLTKLESGVLLLPPALEVVFCLGLVIMRGCDRRHVLLTTEGFTYFSLALLDLLVHVIPAAAQSLTVFKPLDILTGSASSIPLLLYTLFLYLFTAAAFIPTLPARFQVPAKYLLLFFIPEIIAANELGSFVSISYRLFGGTLAVGFTDQSIHTVFDSVTLALLTVYQLLVFGIASYRLAKAFEYRRSIAADSDGNDVKAHLFHGLGWIITGILLGAVDTMIGLAGGGFALALTRRLLRLLGRACLIIGVFNGVDTVEDFRIFKFEAVQQHRRSRLLALISNPRNSTFRQVDGYQFDPEAAQPRTLQQRVSTLASDIMEELRTVSIRFPAGSTPRSSVRATENAGSSAFTSASGLYANSFSRAEMRTRPPTPPLLFSAPKESRLRPQQRVTVHYGNGSPPFLELRRFSDLLDLRSIITLTQLDPFIEPHAFRTKSLPSHLALRGWNASSVARRSSPTLPSLPSNFATEGAGRRSTPTLPSLPSNIATENAGGTTAPLPSATESIISIPESAIIAPVVRVDRAYARRAYAGRDFPSRETVEQFPSSPSDSIEFVHRLTMQFPGTPNTPHWSTRMAPQSVPSDAVSRSSSESDKTFRGPLAMNERCLERAVSSPEPVPEGRASNMLNIMLYGGATDADAEGSRETEETAYGCSGESQETTAVEFMGHHAPITEDESSQAAAAFPTPVSMLMPTPWTPGKYEAQYEQPSGQPTELEGQDRYQAQGRTRKARTLSVGADKQHDDMDRAVESQSTDTDDGEVSATSRRRAPKIKSVGNAPHRRTPTPTSSAVSTRNSIAVELGEAPVDKRRPKISRPTKLQKRNSRSSKIQMKSAVPVASTDDQSVFED